MSVTPSENYFPGLAPQSDAPELVRFLNAELQRISQKLDNIQQQLTDHETRIEALEP